MFNITDILFKFQYYFIEITYVEDFFEPLNIIGF